MAKDRVEIVARALSEAMDAMTERLLVDGESLFTDEEWRHFGSRVLAALDAAPREVTEGMVDQVLDEITARTGHSWRGEAEADIRSTMRAALTAALGVETSLQKMQSSAPPADERETVEAALTKLRDGGWVVAVHNDYRIAGASMTFWLFTHPDGHWIKGEGRTDSDALNICRATARRIAQGGER